MRTICFSRAGRPVVRLIVAIHLFLFLILLKEPLKPSLPVQADACQVPSGATPIVNSVAASNWAGDDSDDPQGNRVLDKWSPEGSLTTSLKDAYPVVSWLAKTHLQAKPTPGKSFNLAPGYYRFVIESYCLQAGTYEPTQGGGYLLAPLKGNLKWSRKNGIKSCPSPSLVVVTPARIRVACGSPNSNASGRGCNNLRCN